MINTDRFPKGEPKKQASRGPGAYFRAIFFWDFNSQKSSESFRQGIYCLLKPFERFQLGMFFSNLKYFYY